MENTRPTAMVVDMKAFEENVSEIKKYVGDKITLIPIIKANGYGTFINTKVDILDRFDIVAVALVDEAVTLRKLGYSKEILVINQPYIDELSKIKKYNITIGLSSKEFLDELLNNSKSCNNCNNNESKQEKVKVHLELETGMGRTGISDLDLEEYIRNVKKCNIIEVEGIYSHMSSADSDEIYTQNQINKFDEGVGMIKKYFNNIKYIHISASNGILNFPNSYYNAVRPGIILYGYEPFDGASFKMRLKPVCKLKSKITFLKNVPENTSIGYSRKFITSRPSKIATIPIGYADGLRRSYSKDGYVVINGKQAKIIGNICMDSFMADVTDFKDINVGDDVYIWDNDLIKLEEVAEKCGTINYEIMSTISDRVPRVFE